MSEKCPKCGSEYFGVREDDTCLSCGYQRVTIFHRITASPEVLAEEFCDTMFSCYNNAFRWYSMLTGEFYNSKAEAIAATVARLKEVENG